MGLQVCECGRAEHSLVCLGDRESYVPHQASEFALLYHLARVAYIQLILDPTVLSLLYFFAIQAHTLKYNHLFLVVL